MMLTEMQHLSIKCSDSFIAWQKRSQKKEECSIAPAVGGSGLHRKKLEEKDNENWTMGRHEGWLGRGPSTVLVRDFAAKMNMFLLRSITQRNRG